MFVWNTLPFCGPSSSTLCPFDPGRLSYLTLGVASVTQVRPFSAPMSLNHSVCFRDGNEWVQRCAGAPGKNYFLFPTGLNEGDNKPRLLEVTTWSLKINSHNRRQSQERENFLFECLYLNLWLKTYLMLELFPWALWVWALPVTSS